MRLLTAMLLLAMIPHMSSAAADSPSSPPDVPLLSVTGTAEIEVPPDHAVIRLGAIAQTDRADTAQQKVNEIVAKAIDQIKDAGIKKDQISTAGLQLSPVYTQPGSGSLSSRGEPQEPKIAGYRASNTIEIRLSDLTKVGAAIDAGVAAGANQIQSLTFDLKDDTDARNRALAAAVKQARSKADAIAKALDVKIIGTREIIEAGSEPAPIPYRGGVAMRAMSAGAPTPIEPGNLSIPATVTIRYEVKD